MRMPNGILLAGLAGLTLLTACGERPPVDTVQLGYRGTGMEQNYNPRLTSKIYAENQPPAALPAADPSGPLASEIYSNVEVLKDLSVGEFTRVMLSMNEWVAPDKQCTYCHVGDNYADGSKYQYQVARRMLQMTRDINSQWKSHVAGTGVTCYTCHKGGPVPAEVWFAGDGPGKENSFIGTFAGQNKPAPQIGHSSLPYDSFTPFLLDAQNIRVASTTALPDGNRSSIKQAEWTYSLMVHMSNSLGVNCTYCHNTQSFADWEISRPQRETAWHGIRMVRSINNDYLVPLTGEFPAERLGPKGDVAKVNCGTCHQGVYKPLYCAPMAKDYPELQAAKALPAGAEPAAADGAAPPGTAPAGEAPAAAAPASGEAAAASAAPAAPAAAPGKLAAASGAARQPG